MTVLSELGYVTLVVDSFRPRSVLSVCRDPFGEISPNTRALDAYGAQAYLQTLPFVDPSRIGVAGWSHGANAVLAAVDSNGITSRIEQQFKSAMAFYPYCFVDGKYALPTLILLGTSDEWAPLHRCKDMQTQSPDGEVNIEIVSYAGATHGFDVWEARGGQKVKGPFGKHI